jgi:hypothetical protein
MISGVIEIEFKAGSHDRLDDDMNLESLCGGGGYPVVFRGRNGIQLKILFWHGAGVLRWQSAINPKLRRSCFPCKYLNILHEILTE